MACGKYMHTWHVATTSWAPLRPPARVGTDASVSPYPMDGVFFFGWHSVACARLCGRARCRVHVCVCDFCTRTLTARHARSADEINTMLNAQGKIEDTFAVYAEGTSVNSKPEPVIGNDKQPCTVSLR